MRMASRTFKHECRPTSVVYLCGPQAGQIASITLDGIDKAPMEISSAHDNQASYSYLT